MQSLRQASSSARFVALSHALHPVVNHAIATAAPGGMVFQAAIGLDVVAVGRTLHSPARLQRRLRGPPCHRSEQSGTSASQASKGFRFVVASLTGLLHVNAQRAR